VTDCLFVVLLVGTALGIGGAMAVSAGEARRRERRITAKVRAVEEGIRMLVASTGKGREYWFGRYFDRSTSDES
jgi:hypothetical protein